MARRPPVGGVHTKMRMDSMEKFFGSQGLASPLEPPGRLQPAVLVAAYGNCVQCYTGQQATGLAKHM